MGKQTDPGDEVESSVDCSVITWDQAVFSFRFKNYIPAGKAKRKESPRENVWEPLKIGPDLRLVQSMFWLAPQNSYEAQKSQISFI